MPAKLKRCVSKVQAKGHSKSSAHAICSKSTGWVKAKGGGWKNKKLGTKYKGK
jgi:hypothetical protein